MNIHSLYTDIKGVKDQLTLIDFFRRQKNQTNIHVYTDKNKNSGLMFEYENVKVIMPTSTHVSRENEIQTLDMNAVTSHTARAHKQLICHIDKFISSKTDVSLIYIGYYWHTQRRKMYYRLFTSIITARSILCV